MAKTIRWLSIVGSDTSKHCPCANFIDHTTTPVEEAVTDVDLVFDTAGADTIFTSAKVLKPNGRLISIAYGAMDKVLAERPDIHAERILVHTSGDDLIVINQFLSDGKRTIHVSRVSPAGLTTQAY